MNGLQDNNILVSNNGLSNGLDIGSFGTFNNSYPFIITDNLVAYLDASNPLSYPGSGTIWYDLSGKGNNASLVSSITFSREKGGCLTTNASTSYINYTTFNLGQQFSICMWLKPIYSTNQSKMFVATKGNYPYNNGFNFYHNGYGTDNRVMQADFGDGTNSNGIGDAFIPRIYYDIWQYVAIVANKTQQYGKIFYNGKLINQGPVTVNFGTNQNMRFGINPVNGYASKFSYSQIQIYSVALSEAQILSNYNAQKRKYIGA